MQYTEYYWEKREEINQRKDKKKRLAGDVMGDKQKGWEEMRVR